MPHLRNEKDGHWADFKIYAEANGISLEHIDDWEPWWQCWNAALDAEDNLYLASIGQHPDDIEDIPDD